MATYTCPMHPEITSDVPGRCPKCGMALVISDGTSKPMTHHTSGDKGLGTLSWESYIPLIVIILMITIVAGIASWSSPLILQSFLLYFMTGFFVVFGTFKLMDLKGFAEGYSTYDILAQRWFG
ncbi:MAG: hypothetical protein MN733_13705, partial [Nitrososphaera sp.]|nr:hypothetical protein [Nitrososphaera sp.]